MKVVPSYQTFAFVLSVADIIVFKLYAHYGDLLKMGLIMDFRSLEMTYWEAILRNICQNSISISSQKYSCKHVDAVIFGPRT